MGPRADLADLVLAMAVPSLLLGGEVVLTVRATAVTFDFGCSISFFVEAAITFAGSFFTGAFVVILFSTLR